MRKLLIFLVLFPVMASADVLSLEDALRATYTACVGIDDELADMKKMAGINTAVTAVGTAAGAGATVVGIVKANKDSQAKTTIDNMNKNLKYTEESVKQMQWESAEDEQRWLDDFKAKMRDEVWKNDVKKLRDQSKNLGNWRTGLMAGNTATNIAGAIIAGNNKVDEDLQTQIDNCKASVKNLRDAMMQARMDGEDISEANEIVSACGEYEYVDVSSINKRGKGAMISSIVGATTGVAGTVTSSVANSENVRGKDEEQMTRSNEEWQNEKNWNTAANVLAGTSTVASGVATVFNATQISAIKKVANVASKCTGVLK